MITIIKDIDLITKVFNYDVILIPMSIYNSMNRGFKYDISINFPIVKKEESQTPYGDNRKYGTTFCVNIDKLTFCCCYMYKPLFNKKNGIDTVNYEALEKCLQSVSMNFHEANIASPILGNSKFDGNGNKEKIIKLFSKCFNDKQKIDLYDYEQKDSSLLIFHKIAHIHKLLKEKKITADEYVKKRSEIEWIRKNGIYKKMPLNYKYVTKRIKDKWQP